MLLVYSPKFLEYLHRITYNYYCVSRIKFVLKFVNHSVVYWFAKYYELIYLDDFMDFECWETLHM